MATSVTRRSGRAVAQIVAEHGVHPDIDSRAILRRWRHQRRCIVALAAVPAIAGLAALLVAPSDHWPGVVLALPALISSGLLAGRSQLLRPSQHPLQESAWAVGLALTVVGAVLAMYPLGWAPWLRGGLALTCGALWLAAALAALLPGWNWPAPARLVLLTTGCASLILIRLV